MPDAPYSTFDSPLATPPKEETPKEPEKPTQPVDEAVPLARFNEVYGKWKEAERTVQDLSQRLGTIEERLNKPTEEPEPDPDEDPEAFRNYWRNKAKQPSQQTNQPSRAAPDPKLDTLVEAARMVWPDYDDIVGPHLARIENDPDLKQRIMASRNPPAEAYKWAKELKAKQTTTQDQMRFEAPTLDGDAFFESDADLTKEEQEMAKRFGMSEEEWKGHRKAVAKDRERMFSR